MQKTWDIYRTNHQGGFWPAAKGASTLLAAHTLGMTENEFWRSVEGCAAGQEGASDEDWLVVREGLDITELDGLEDATILE